MAVAKVQALEGHGFRADGHGVGRAEMLAQTRTQLVAGGMTLWDADESVMDRPGLVTRAWWGGDELGFVGEDHPAAVPVTVVNLPPPGPSATPAPSPKAVG